MDIQVSEFSVNMTEEEYLELKEFYRNGLARAEELRKQLPIDDKLYVPSFEIGFREPPTAEEKKKHDAEFEVLHQLWLVEEDNNFAVQLIQSYEYDKSIK